MGLEMPMDGYDRPPTPQASLARPLPPPRSRQVAPLAAWSERLPLLIISGTKDSQVMGDIVVSEMKPHFTMMDVCMIVKGGGHAVHYENPAKVLASIGSFVKKVKLE